MAHVYWAENWIAGAVLGCLGGLSVSAYLRWGNIFREYWIPAALLAVGLFVWALVMLAVRFTMKKRENDMVLLWALERMSKERENEADPNRDRRTIGEAAKLIKSALD